MLRRLASLGQIGPEHSHQMSPSPGDENVSSEARSSGGLAGVFRGLTGAKLAKSPAPQQQQQFRPPSILATGTQMAAGAEDAAANTIEQVGLPPGQAEVFDQLKNGTLPERIAAATSLRYAITGFPSYPVLDIWDAGKDLIHLSDSGARIAGWELLSECTKYTSSTDLERREYFQTLAAPANPEDFHLQLAALEDLTDHGRNVAGFYYEIFPLLTVWLQKTYLAVKTARKQASRGGAKTSKGKAISSGEDKNFSQLFAFLKDVIKFNLKFASDKVVGNLLDRLLKICMDTSVEEDLKACISVIDAVVIFGTIPSDKLKNCIHVLSSIHCLVPSLQKDSWHVLGNICKSHHGQSTVRILLDVLRTFPSTSDQERPKEMEKSQYDLGDCPGIEVDSKDAKEAKDAKEGKDVIRDVRGSLSVLQKLLSKLGEKGYPPVPLSLLVNGLENISERTSSSKVSTAILRLINSLLDGREGQVSPIILEERWNSLFDVAAECYEKDGRAMTTNGGSASRPIFNRGDADNDDTVSYQLNGLINKLETLLTQKGPNFTQREECIHFLSRVHHALPDSAVELVLSHLKEHRSYMPPSDFQWQSNVDLVLEGFLLDRNRRPLTRIQALEAVTEVFDFLDTVQDMEEAVTTDDLVRRVLVGVPKETDTLVLQEMVSLLVRAAEDVAFDLFEDILDAFKKVVANERIRSPTSTPTPQSSNPQNQQGYVANQSLTNVVTRGYVQVFIRAMNKHGTKALKTYDAIVHIARSNGCETDARLTAMKMLFRLRGDFENRIYLAQATESEELASTLFRTETSLARKLAEDAAQPSRSSRSEQAATSRTSRGVSFTQGQVTERGLPLRSSNTSKLVLCKNQRLWSLPDPDALPQSPPERPSHLMVSYLDGDSNSGGQLDIAVLNTAPWLDALLSLFHQGCDWEIYSFILVHLPAQLGNHPLFKGAVHQIQELRRTLCEMIRTSSYHEPPSSSGLRKNDVANCLFHSLSMILSYHHKFQKSDEDEIVRTFTVGITEKTAKICIHALSVCCHELPLSTSKSLVTILQKMSQVITQPFVAMHILEFLACLGRLHNLHSNFRDEEFRIVFGICVRYLQYVRDKKRVQRATNASEPSTLSSAFAAGNQDLLSQHNSGNDLPEYVYALAYHVITFWFLAVKVPDRPNHIAWIAKNLFTDVDGSPTNEEQAQITIDFMQRVAFSDANDSMPESLFKEEFYGEIVEKAWVIGNSIVTIKQAKDTGWAEIIRRYPSGMSVFSVKSKFTPTPAHQARDSSDAGAWDGRLQVGSTIYPSHLLLQLLAPIPQVFDPITRPIPLPDDEAIARAIRMFDLNSTVDGHKVGVIYIGEGQTKESDILGNTIGSPDYHEFLRGLGVLTKLKGATFNTQGLDRSGFDGLYTICWRDRVTEMVFHVTTQMPNDLANDPQFTRKKSHIGNDFVNIVFNDSGLPFNFDTFPSAFNYVYIVITPNPRSSFVAGRERAQLRPEEIGPLPFFTVQVKSKPGFPEISPAAEPKMVNLKNLASFVRLLGLNASVFCSVWADRIRNAEHISSWRSRLRQINVLRERHGPKMAPAPSPPPSSLGAPAVGTSGTVGQGPLTQAIDGSRPPSSMRDSFSSIRRSSVATFFTTGSTDAGNSTRSSMVSTATTDNTEIMPMNGAEALVDSVDFSRWA